MIHLLVLHAHALTTIETPLPLDSPVFSLATTDAHTQPNMNILTYASPVAIRPHRLWAISLYRKTATYDNWRSARTGILQHLATHHAPLTQTLGGTSAKTASPRAKADACAELGFAWERVDSQPEMLLPRCVCYYRLVQHGESIDAGDHEIAICRVESVWTSCGDEPPPAPLSTQALRDANLITLAGRAVGPDE